MTVSEILSIVFGGISLPSIVLFLIYFKENKRLKQNEVKNSDAAAQTQQIDLADLYKNKVVELTELMMQMAKKQESGNENQERMIKKLDALTEQSNDHSRKLDRQDERADAMENLLGYVVRYLNGGLQSFIDQQKKGGADEAVH